MKKFVIFLLTVSMVLGLAACGGAAAEEPITVVLDWTPNTNHTGIYVALANGYFEEAGLNVQVVQPPEDGAVALVASGKAQFGVSFQDSLAPAFAGDSPMPVTAVAALIQHNTSGIVSRAGEGMDTPKGLEGKKYATWDLDVEKATIRDVMEADGGNFDLVELIPSTVTDEVSALQSGSVDAIWIFYGWAGIACEVAGLETDYFEFADIDPVFDYYTPVLIGNNAWLEENPDTAKAFFQKYQDRIIYGSDIGSRCVLAEGYAPLARRESLARMDLIDGLFSGEVDTNLLLTALVTIVPLSLATMVEHIGDMCAISSTCEKNYLEEPGFHRTLLGDGLATALASLFGAPANTTYGENTGVLALSKVYDPKVIRLAALFAMVLAFCPKFAALIVAMPAATMGGVSLVLYGMISAVGVRNVVENQVDFTKSRNVLIAAMIMGLAVGVTYAGSIIIPLGAITISLSGLAVAAIVGIVMNAILPGKDYEFGVNEAGDNAVNFGTSAYKDDKK